MSLQRGTVVHSKTAVFIDFADLSAPTLVRTDGRGAEDVAGTGGGRADPLLSIVASEMRLFAVRFSSGDVSRARVRPPRIKILLRMKTCVA